jgi:hypothetical protein
VGRSGTKFPTSIPSTLFFNMAAQVHSLCSFAASGKSNTFTVFKTASLTSLTPNLGKLGDALILEATTLAIYVKLEQGWCEWPGMNATSPYTQHPEHPSHFLYMNHLHKLGWFQANTIGNIRRRLSHDNPPLRAPAGGLFMSSIEVAQRITGLTVQKY